MPSCHEMKKGEIYVCEDCGLEIQVVKECKDCGQEEAACGCDEDCNFACCGEEMKKKAP
jgi:hypothetical protein